MMRALTIAVAALFGMAGAIQGQTDPWRTEVEHALAEARTRLGPSELVGAGPHLGLLVEGEMAMVTVPLIAGMTYVALAACDRDCDRLSLRVVDPRRYELDVDRSATLRPVLHFSPVMGGDHRIEIGMTGCRVSPCRYGVLLLAIPRPRTSEVRRSALISPHANAPGTPRLVARPALDLRPGGGNARRRRGAGRAVARLRRRRGQAAARGDQVARRRRGAPRPGG